VDKTQMIKKVTSVFIIFFLIVLPFIAPVDGQTPPPSDKSGNFSKKTFSNNNSWSKGGKALTPPAPNGTGSTGGNRIPISGGLAFLLFGSTIYLIKRVRDEKL
jgi:hypothetical protein